MTDHGDTAPAGETQPRGVLATGLRRAGRELGKAVLLTVGCALLALAVNAVRGKKHGGIDVFARAPYDIYTDCPEMDANIPKLKVGALRVGHRSLIFVDARPTASYLAGHIRGAQSMPMYGNSPNAPGGLEYLRSKRGRFIVVYGQDQMQSAVHLASHLRQHGVRGIHLIDGDLKAWKAAGRSLVSRKIPQITAAALRLAKGVVLVDARPKAQYDAAHLPGAVNLPFDGLVPPDKKRFAALLREKRTVVAYGVSAVDEELADAESAAGPKDVGRLLAGELVALGARRVKWLPGGCKAWTQAGGALTAPGKTKEPTP